MTCGEDKIVKKFSWFILALLVFLSFGVTAEVLYTQDFSGNKMPEDFRIVEGFWSVQDGRLVGEASGAVQGRVVFGPQLEDFVYSADVSFLSVANDSRWFSIFFRSTTTGMAPYHMFTIRQNAKAANGTELAFREPGGNWDVRRTAAYKNPFKIGETYRIKVAVKGDYFFYFIEDELMFAAYEKGYRKDGIFGLHVNGCKVAFDNIKIETFNSAEYADLEKQVAKEASPILPRIVAHRGNSSVAPENTLAAIRSAIEVGSDQVEIDVHMTKDGEIVLMHDGTVDRTTNGKGSVSQMTLAEIRELDAGIKKSANFKGEKVPTLREALLEVKDKARLVIELKPTGFEQKVIDIVDELGMRDQVAIISFNAYSIRKVREIAPDIPAAILIGSAKDYKEIERIAKSANTTLLDLAYPLINKQMAAYFLDRGYSLWAWTVDNVAVMEQMQECGVTLLTTNVPSTAINALRTQK